MTRLMGFDGTEYVQAWECIGPAFVGYVYSMDVMLSQLEAGCNVRTVVIVRHGDGTREYLPGALVHEVWKLREHQPPTV